MDSSMLTRAKASLHKTKLSLSLANPKDPTKCEECKLDLPYHSRKCVSGKLKLCDVCGRDKTYNHQDAVCVLVAENRSKWSPDVEADAHAAALRKQGDLPPTPVIESQSSLKRANSEDEHQSRDPPARIDDKDAMDADDLYIPDEHEVISQAPQVDDDMGEDIDEEYEDPAIAERVSRLHMDLTKEIIESISNTIAQPFWTANTPWQVDPIRSGKVLADVASDLVKWVSQAHMLDDDTVKENKANEGLLAFHTTYRIHSPGFKHVFDDIHLSAQVMREQQLTDNLSSMSRSIMSLSAMVTQLVEKTDKIEKQISHSPSSIVSKSATNATNKPQVKFLQDPIGSRFVHDNRFPPTPLVVKQHVPAPKGGKSSYDAAIAKTRVPGSGYRMDSEGLIIAPDGYAHSAHNAPRSGIPPTKVYYPPVQSVGTDKEGFTTVTYAKAVRKPRQTPTKVNRPSIDHPEGEVTTVPVNRSIGSVNIRPSNIKRVYFTLPGDLAVRPTPTAVKNSTRAGLKGNPTFKHLVVLNVEYTTNSNLLIAFTNIRNDYDANYVALVTQLERILNINGARAFRPSPQFKMVIPGVPVFDRETNLIYSEADLLNEISALPQFEGREFMYPPRFMSSVEKLNERDFCNVSVVMKDPDRLSFDHFFLHDNRSIPIFGTIRRLEEMKARPTISQCDNCHRLGHQAAKCRSVSQCATCSEPHRTALHFVKCASCTSSNNVQCDHFAHCINCQGNHSARSSECPARHNFRSPF